MTTEQHLRAVAAALAKQRPRPFVSPFYLDELLTRAADELDERTRTIVAIAISRATATKDGQVGETSLAAQVAALLSEVNALRMAEKWQNARDLSVANFDSVCIALLGALEDRAPNWKLAKAVRRGWIDGLESLYRLRATFEPADLPALRRELVKLKRKIRQAENAIGDGAFRRTARRGWNPEWTPERSALRKWIDQAAIKDRILDRLPELRGKDLACWCKPGAPCHADVLLELANATNDSCAISLSK